MLDKGLNKKELLTKLKKIQGQNQRYKDGRILCSMCTTIHPIAKKTYRLFMESNIGDSGLFPGSAKLEKEAIEEMSILLNGKGSVGFMVSGGTEANLMGLLAARNMAKVSNPEVVLPQSAHFSFEKICSMLNLKPVHASLDSSFKADPLELKS